jgi:signal transduction histidine kinase
MIEQVSQERPEWREQLRRPFTLNIRGKIVLPYLVLTLVVAVVGVYVVMELVAGSLDERLTNHLLEAGRVVSDSLARQELDHIEAARSVAFTVGLAEALQDGNRARVTALAQPVAAVRGVEALIVVDVDGQEMAHALQQADGSLKVVEGRADAAGLWIVQTLLESGDPNALPKRGLGLHRADQRYYYFTAVPVEWEDEIVGVVVVGTSLNTLLPHFKTISLADVIIYLNDGRAIATTFGLDAQLSLETLSITPEWYEQILFSDDLTIGQNIQIRNRPYRLAQGPLRVGDERLGVFSVALPSNFIIEQKAISRNTYTVIFFTAMVGVIVIGYMISQRITNPLSRLVRTSRAVAEGNLDQRTGIVSGDEIGLLAETFDEMTGRLADRTRALEETLGRLRAILSSIGDGVLLEDLNRNYVPLNAAADALLHEMADDFLLGPLRELSVADDRDKIEDVQPGPWLLERRRFGIGEKVISAHSAAVRTEDGKYLGTVIVLRDVTAEAEAERLKDAFVTHVSHELRTPLTAIKGYSELLLASTGDALEKAQRGFLETISRHTENLVAMINALLDFSEMEASGRLGLRQHPVLLSTLVEEIAEEWRPQMDEKKLAFQVEIPAELPLVDADIRRLRWAIINLVRNAWQYTPEGGSVTMRLYQDDGQVILDVMDTGVGISPENQQRLFSRFYRVAQEEREQDDEVRGLGIGLYVTNAIAEAHGGEVRIVSEEDGGSTFSIVLPAMPDSEDEDTT